jgi:hypothetical protein
MSFLTLSSRGGPDKVGVLIARGDVEAEIVCISGAVTIVGVFWQRQDDSVCLSAPI